MHFFPVMTYLIMLFHGALPPDAACTLQWGGEDRGFGMACRSAPAPRTPTRSR